MPKKREPNWKNIERLRDRLKALKQTRHRKFNMRNWIEIISGGKAMANQKTITVEKLRKDGPECGSAGCLFGECVIAFAPLKLKLPLVVDYEYDSRGEGVNIARAVKQTPIFNFAKKFLGLSEEESKWMSSGSWSYGWIDSLTKRDAIRYLDKVLKEKSVMTSID